MEKGLLIFGTRTARGLSSRIREGPGAQERQTKERQFSILVLFVAYCNTGKASTFTPLFGSQVGDKRLGVEVVNRRVAPVV